MADAGGLFGLLSIFKNEAHIMAEWVDHYVAEGVDKFYLIDNGSTDDYMPILTPHIVSGLVVLVKDAKRHAQVEHYNKHFHSWTRAGQRRMVRIRAPCPYSKLS